MPKLLEMKLVNAETALIEHSPYKVFRILQTLYYNIIGVEEESWKRTWQVQPFVSRFKDLEYFTSLQSPELPGAK